MGSKIKVGVFGAGVAGHHHLEAFSQMSESVEVVGFAEIDDDKRIKIENEFDIPGFATKEDMIKVINSNKIKYWDAPNYYIESGDLRDISTIKNFLT